MRNPDDIDEAADELRDDLRMGDATRIAGATYRRDDEAEDVADCDMAGPDAHYRRGLEVSGWFD